MSTTLKRLQETLASQPPLPPEYGDLIKKLQAEINAMVSEPNYYRTDSKVGRNILLIANITIAVLTMNCQTAQALQAISKTQVEMVALLKQLVELTAAEAKDKKK